MVTSLPLPGLVNPHPASVLFLLSSQQEIVLIPAGAPLPPPSICHGFPSSEVIFSLYLLYKLKFHPVVPGKCYLLVLLLNSSKCTLSFFLFSVSFSVTKVTAVLTPRISTEVWLALNFLHLSSCIFCVWLLCALLLLLLLLLLFINLL